MYAFGASMKTSQKLSAAAFFIAIPFLGLSYSPISSQINPIPLVVVAGALGLFCLPNAFGSGSHGRGRLDIMGFRLLFGLCAIVVVAGLAQAFLA